MQISKNLSIHYKNLIEQIYSNKDSFSEKEITLFTAGVGKEYNNKLLVVGRAPNGWYKIFDKTNKSDKSRIKNEIELDDLDWVIENKENNYNINTSAFWRLTKKLAGKLIGPINTHNLTNDAVIDKIAWTNLYKISKSARSNPSEKLMNIQFDFCKKILFAEIELFKPEIVLFLTGCSWAVDFLEETTELKPNKQDNRYVKFAGKYKNSLLIVSQHPQGKPESEHVEEIMQIVMKNIT